MHDAHESDARKAWLVCNVSLMIAEGIVLSKSGDAAQSRLRTVDYHRRASEVACPLPHPRFAAINQRPERLREGDIAYQKPS